MRHFHDHSFSAFSGFSVRKIINIYSYSVSLTRDFSYFKSTSYNVKLTTRWPASLNNSNNIRKCNIYSVLYYLGCFVFASSWNSISSSLSMFFLRDWSCFIYIIIYYNIIYYYIWGKIRQVYPPKNFLSPISLKVCEIIVLVNLS